MSRLYWFDVDTILNTWKSQHNIGGYQSWGKYLDTVIRKDKAYVDIKNSIKKYGFRYALTYFQQHGETFQYDGHHRLAAAIELGYKYVPYRKVKNEYSIYGCLWDSHNYTVQNENKIKYKKRIYLHPNNPIPECLNTPRS